MGSGDLPCAIAVEDTKTIAIPIQQTILLRRRLATLSLENARVFGFALVSVIVQDQNNFLAWRSIRASLRASGDWNNCVATGPLSLPLPRIAPKAAIRGERRRIGQNADPERREGDGGPKLPPSLDLGYILTPLHGSEDEAAASLPLHFLRSAQSPVLLFGAVGVLPSSLSTPNAGDQARRPFGLRMRIF